MNEKQMWAYIMIKMHKNKHILSVIVQIDMNRLFSLFWTKHIEKPTSKYPLIIIVMIITIINEKHTRDQPHSIWHRDSRLEQQHPTQGEHWSKKYKRKMWNIKQVPLLKVINIWYMGKDILEHFCCE